MAINSFVVLAHLPLVRIEEEIVPFASGHLWRMPYKEFDEITGGAFSSYKKSYEATSPVFYKIVEALDLSKLKPSNLESTFTNRTTISNNDKIPFDLGLDFLYFIHETIVDRAWKSLTLAAPAAAYPHPLLSFTILNSIEEAYFEINNQKTNWITIQGDADLEYLFFPDSAGPPLSPKVIQHASSLLDLVDKIGTISELKSALLSLLSTSSPSLSKLEQHTMSVITLESLILPEIRSGLRNTFSNRLSTLLASNSKDLLELRDVLGLLYKSRSAAVHGQPSRVSKSFEELKFINDGYAQQILASTIITIANRYRLDTSFEKLRSELDNIPSLLNNFGRGISLSNPPGLSSTERVVRAPSSISIIPFSSGSNMGSEEGTLLS
jgi:hypothetical protein